MKETHKQTIRRWKKDGIHLEWEGVTGKLTPEAVGRMIAAGKRNEDLHTCSELYIMTYSILYHMVSEDLIKNRVPEEQVRTLHRNKKHVKSVMDGAEGIIDQNLFHRFDAKYEKPKEELN